MSYAHNQPEYAVSELAGKVKRLMEGEFGHVRVRGEISKCHVIGSSGHAYITLKDDKSVLEAVCWRGVFSKLTHKPEVGMEVIVTGRITTYAPRSQYQLVIENLEPAGQGALMERLLALKKQLTAEGLFDAARKKELPFLPQVIGVITSPTGAVIRDILHRIADRFPAHVLLWPVMVQGKPAAAQIAQAIAGFQHFGDGSKFPKPDLLIVARGGGSVEDLWAFNEEVVVRAVAASAIPIISAVGHETDTTLIDYAADWRAPTPTAAAEKAVPVRAQLHLNVSEFGLSLSRSIERKLGYAAEKLGYQQTALARFARNLQEKSQRLDELSERLKQAPMRGLMAKQARLSQVSAPMQASVFTHKIQAMQHRFSVSTNSMLQAMKAQVSQGTHRLEMQASKLGVLDVKQVLKRGFAIVKDAGGKPLTSAVMARAHPHFMVEFHDDALAVMQTKAPVKTKRKTTAKNSNQESLF
jgi:exodeoxyribonuclease VII large subunit